MRLAKVSRRAIEIATDDTGDPWAVSNAILYRLCRRHPRHDNAPAVTAKVLLIGRSYAAALERGRLSSVDSDATNDLFYTRDVPRVLRNSELDARLARLRSKRDINAALTEILGTHSYLCSLFAKLTGRTKRSLASKYLHFHLPHLFFIFDSRASRGLRLLRPHSLPPARVPPRGDREYQRFFLHALALRQKLEHDFGVRLNPRQVDRLLLAAVADFDT